MYTYDQNEGGVGHLTTMRDPSGMTQFAYDKNGHMIEKNQQTGSTRLMTQMDYNAAGQMTSMRYPSGRVVNTGYDAAGRI